MSVEFDKLMQGTLGERSLYNENLVKAEAEFEAVEKFMLRRVSSNQGGDVSGGNLVGWSRGPGVTFSVHSTIAAGDLWASRSTEEQALMLEMGYAAGVQYFKEPEQFNIVKMVWTGRTPGNWAFFQSSRHIRDCLITACYAKLVSGSFRSPLMFEGARPGVWTACGSAYAIDTNGTSGVYRNAHPTFESAEGEVLFVLPTYMRSPTAILGEIIRTPGWLKGMPGANEAVSTVGNY